jgi:hypothetical protein
VILGFYAGKSHNLIGLGIFHGDLDFFELKSILSNSEEEKYSNTQPFLNPLPLSRAQRKDID